MNKTIKPTGAQARIITPDFKHNRTFFGEDSYKRAVQWTDKLVAQFEAQGYRPHVVIKDLYI
jgi:hypothetical protein